MNRAFLAAALALPIAGLTAGIAAREAALQDASSWRIPITGFDPRDPIRGRYIEFAYAWQVRGDADRCSNTGCTLCLGRGVNDITATIAVPGGQCPNALDVQASAIDVRTPPAGDAPLQFVGRIFVSETSAPRLELLLRDRPMEVAARLTRGGRLVHDRLQPAARPQETD